MRMQALMVLRLAALAAALVLPGTAFGASPEDVVGAGDGFFLRKEYDFAIDEYQSFLKQFPDHKEADRARYQLGECHYRLKKYDKAAEVFGVLSARKPAKALRVKTLYRLGECRAQLQEFDKAAAAYGELVGMAPKDRLAPAALYSQSEAYYGLKKYREAAAACQKLVEAYGDSKYAPVALYSLGWARFELGEYGDAVKAFEGVVAQYPKEAFAGQSQLKAGECFFKQKEFRKALAAYAKVVEDFPGKWSDEALMGAGSCHYELKAYGEAARAFESVAEKYPKEPDAPLALLNAANSHLADGQAAKAVVVADRFDAAYAQSKVAPRVKAARARALLKLARAGDAARAFTAAIQAGLPKLEQPAAYFGLGEALFGAKKFKDALTAYRYVVSKFGEHKLAEDAAYSMVYCHAELGEDQQAVEQCQSFARAHPDSRLMASVKQVEGEHQYRLKHYEAARDACLASLARDAKGAYADDAMYKLAWAYRQLGDHGKAGAQFLKLAATFKASPFAAESLYLAGESAAVQGQVATAAGHFRACEKKFGKSPFASKAGYRLALLYYQTQDYKQAAAQFKGFLAAHPQSDLVKQALVYAGESAFQLKDYATARSHYERQLRDFPKAGAQWADVAIYGVAWCDRKDGKMAVAVDGFRRVLSRFPKSKLVPESSYWAARSLEDDKKFTEAAAAFKDFAEQHRTHALAEEAAYRTGSALLNAGEYQQAVSALETFIEASPKSKLADNATYDLAWCHKSLKQPGKAIAAYEKLIDTFPDSDVQAHALFDLGNLLFDAKRFSDAIARYEAAAAKGEKILQHKVYYKLGLAWARENKPEKAADAFSKLIAECPRSELLAEAHYRYGLALKDQGKLAGAVDAFDKAIAAKPKDELTEFAMFHVAECHREQKNWAKGLGAYKAAIERFPQSQLIHKMRYGQGVCAQNLGAYADAVEAYQAVYNAVNTVTAARARYGVAECSMLQGKFKEAMKAFALIEILYGYAEWRAAGLYMAGQCAEKLKDVERARKYYKRIIDEEDFRATSYGAKAKVALGGL